MTKAFTMPIEDERAPPPWLVSAFLVLFGVAIAAAMPAIAAAARISAEAAASGHNAGVERIVVRATIKISRAILPSSGSGSDLVPTFVSTAPIVRSDDRIAPRIADQGTTTVERGIKIRAPPGTAA